MESREGINSTGGTVAAEAPSSYHVAPRSDNSSQVTGLPHPLLPFGSFTDGGSGKKKRGRPRKYGPDGPGAHKSSPLPISVSPSPASSGFTHENQADSSAVGVSSGEIIATPATGVVSAHKPRKGRPIGSQNKPRHNSGSEISGELIACSSGGSFTPHTITVSVGEDVTEKIIALSHQGPRSVCVISANGMISSVTLRQFSSGGTYAYEGNFDILSLSGSFAPTTSNGPSSNRVGSMSITLADPDGHIVGGLIAGPLIAASPVQVVIGSFLPINQVEKSKKHKYEHKVAMSPTNVEHNDTRKVTLNYSDDPNGTVPPSYRTTSWPTMPMMQESRSTDINISLQED